MDYKSLYAALADKAPQLDERGFPIGTPSGITSTFSPDEYAQRYIQKMNSPQMYHAIAQPTPTTSPVDPIALQHVGQGMKSVK